MEDTLTQLKSKYGDIYQIDVTTETDTFKFFLKKPDRNTYAVCLNLAHENKFYEVGKIVVKNCLVDSSITIDKVEEDPELLTTLYHQAQDLITLYASSIKKL
jgi:hypothetical protein